MKWPFGSKDRGRMAPISPVELTEDEQRECQAMLRSLTQTDSGEYFVQEDVADSFKRSVIAFCLMGRAERFLIHSNSQRSYGEEACRTAAKACAIFPLSIYFYDFGCVLQQVGKQDEAKEMFREFVRRYRTEHLDAVMKSTLNQRDVESALRHAQGEV
jgi:hypothetical protein